MKKIRLLGCANDSCLKVFKNENLPRFEAEVTFNNVRDSDAKILARLQRSNTKLNTSLWKIKKRSLVQKNKGLKLCFGIDLDSLEEIKRKKCKAFYGMGSIKFRLNDKIPLFYNT